MPCDLRHDRPLHQPLPGARMCAGPDLRGAMSIRICVLPTQYDIIDFRQGRRPENIFVREFASAAEAQAYEDGIDAIDDQYDRVEELRVVDAKVIYSLRSADPEIDGQSRGAEKAFVTPAEAAAFSRGLADAEGYAAPLLVDDTDDRLGQLLAWSASP